MLLIPVLILIVSICLSVLFSNQEFFENKNPNKLNIVTPPNYPNSYEYTSNKMNYSSNFSNDNLNLKSKKTSETMCFPKPNLKYDGIWSSHIENKSDNSIRKWNFNDIDVSMYCGQSPSFGFYDTSIDNKYVNDDDCEGEEKLKLCRIDNNCDDIYLCDHYFTNEFDIYLFPSSMFDNNIYEDYIELLDSKGKIINVNYPEHIFDLNDFCEKIYNKIISRNKKCILFGWSFGTLICNLINDNFKNNKLLKKMLLISNSCTGILSQEAMTIYKQLYKKTIDENTDENTLLYKLLFPPNVNITHIIKNKIERNKLSLKNQSIINKSIGRFLSKPHNLCKNENDVDIRIIHGKQDIVYPLENKKIQEL